MRGRRCDRLAKDQPAEIAMFQISEVHNRQHSTVGGVFCPTRSHRIQRLGKTLTWSKRCQIECVDVVSIHLRPCCWDFDSVSSSFKVGIPNSLRFVFRIVLHTGIMSASRNQSVWQGRTNAARQFSFSLERRHATPSICLDSDDMLSCPGRPRENAVRQNVRGVLPINVSA